MLLTISFLSVFIFSITGLVGCSQAPTWTPQVVTKPAVQLARDSSMIVLGTVASENTTGPTVAVGKDGRVRLQKIDFDVEAVLKGNIDSSRISFYRYRWYADWILQSPPIDPIMPGERSIFFLDRTDGNLKTALDVTVSRVKIFSGAHDYRSLRLSDLPMEDQIAYLMLAPGNNVPEDVFGEMLSRQALDAMTLVG